MIDLTAHLTTENIDKIGALQMSGRAAAQLRRILRAHYAPEFCAPAHFAPIVAQSVASFLTSDYFTHSVWFRQQPVHTVGVCLVNACEQYAPIFHVTVSRTGHMVVTPAERPLPEDYFEQRVIAEVRVENGISDFTDRPHGRTP